MDAEIDLSPPPENWSLKGDWFERPLPWFLLCALRVSAVHLRARRLNRYGLANQIRPTGNSRPQPKNSQELTG